MSEDWCRSLVLFLVLLGILPTTHGRSTKSGGGDFDTHLSSTNSSIEERELRDHHLPDGVQVGCKELRAKRYISDGYCTSIKPIREVVCVGNCLPIRELPWYSEFVKFWSHKKLQQWQCEEDLVRRKNVRLLCKDNSNRTYKIKVVKSCKCKKIVDEHNRTKRKGRRRRRRKQRKNKKHRKGKQQQQKQTVNVSSNAP